MHCLFKLLTGIFVDEWNGLFQVKELDFTPTLRFKLFNQDVVIEFKDLITATLDVSFSIGGTYRHIELINTRTMHKYKM